MADSHEIPRVPCYSGTQIARRHDFTYGALTHSGRPSQTLQLPHRFITDPHPGRGMTPGPTTPQPQHLPTITRSWFRLLRFRSPLLTEYLFNRVLRCFTSPTTHHLPYTFRQRRLAITPARLPHSETLGSPLARQLPEEYRRPPRPSSALHTKASTERPKHLQKQNKI